MRKNKIKESKGEKSKQTKSKTRQKNKVDEEKNAGKEEYYEIETILAHKKKKEKSGKYEHLIKVKWKGYKKTEWCDEDMLREDVASELDKYFNAKKKEKLMKDSKKRSNKKQKKDDTPKVLKCVMNHQLSSSFRKTENAWEVSKVKCNGGCGKNYTDEICNIKNPVWVCEGNKNECYCSILFCNECFLTKILEGSGMKSRVRTTRRNKAV